MFNSIVNNINAGFVNCIFINKDNESVSGTMLKKMADADAYFSRVPEKIDLSPIDDMHDSIVLDYGTDKLSGKITWGRTNDQRFYLFKEFVEN